MSSKNIMFLFLFFAMIKFTLWGFGFQYSDLLPPTAPYILLTMGKIQRRKICRWFLLTNWDILALSSTILKHVHYSRPTAVLPVTCAACYAKQMWHKAAVALTDVILCCVIASPLFFVIPAYKLGRYITRMWNIIPIIHQNCNIHTCSKNCIWR